MSTFWGAFRLHTHLPITLFLSSGSVIRTNEHGNSVLSEHAISAERFGFKRI